MIPNIQKTLFVCSYEGEKLEKFCADKKFDEMSRPDAPKASALLLLFKRVFQMPLETILRQITWREYQFHVPSVEKSLRQEIHCHITRVTSTEARHEKAKRNIRRTQVKSTQGHPT